MNDWIIKLFQAIDKKDAKGFVSFLTKDASFRFGSSPAVAGRDNIQKTVEIFFSTIKNLNHRILEVWEQSNTVICEGEVTYTLSDGRRLTLPFMDILRMKDGLIADYRIYVDPSSLNTK